MHQRDVLYQDCEIPRWFLLRPHCWSSYTRNGSRFRRLRFDHPTPAESTLAVLNFLRSFPVTFHVKGLDVQLALQTISYILLKIMWCKCFTFTASSFCLNPFQPKLILVHTTVTGTCHRAYKTCKNWPLCSYVGWHQHSQPNAEKSAQCAKMSTGANGQKACILRTDEKHDAIWHHGAGKG